MLRGQGRPRRPDIRSRSCRKLRLLSPRTCGRMRFRFWWSWRTGRASNVFGAVLRGRSPVRGDTAGKWCRCCHATRLVCVVGLQFNSDGGRYRNHNPRWPASAYTCGGALCRYGREPVIDQDLRRGVKQRAGSPAGGASRKFHAATGELREAQLSGREHIQSGAQIRGLTREAPTQHHYILGHDNAQGFEAPGIRSITK